MEPNTDVVDNGYLNYTNELVQALAGGLKRYPRLKDGVYKGLITDAKFSVNPKTNNVQLLVIFEPYGADGSLCGVCARGFFDIPMNNSKVPGHKFTKPEALQISDIEFVQQAHRKLEGLVRASGADIARYPLRNKENKTYELSDGTQISQKDYAITVEKIKRGTLDTVMKWAAEAGPSRDQEISLVGSECYFGVKLRGQYSNATWAGNNPGKQAVLTTDFLV